MVMLYPIGQIGDSAKALCCATSEPGNVLMFIPSGGAPEPGSPRYQEQDADPRAATATWKDNPP